MGMERSIKLSFYFELNEKVKEAATETRYRCSNNNCDNHRNTTRYKNGNFCSSCGGKHEEVIVSLGDRLPDAYDFCDEHLHGEEIVANPSSEGAMPNNIWLYNKRLNFDSLSLDSEVLEYGGIIDLASFNADKLLKLFLEEEEVKVFLNQFQKAYGPNLITPKIGLVSTWG